MIHKNSCPFHGKINSTIMLCEGIGKATNTPTAAFDYDRPDKFFYVPHIYIPVFCFGERTIEAAVCHFLFITTQFSVTSVTRSWKHMRSCSVSHASILALTLSSFGEPYALILSLIVSEKYFDLY